MKKILILLIVLVFLLAGCSGDNSSGIGSGDSEAKGKANSSDDRTESGSGGENEEDALYEKIYIDVDLQNEQTDEYYLFFVKPGTIGTGGDPTEGRNFYGPIEVENFKAEVEVAYDIGISNLLDQLDEDKLQLVITTREDFLIRNPLNKDIFIYFEENEEWFGAKLATQERFTIPIVDKYPDGVLSLAWQDADFVVRLNFKEGVEPRESYLVGIREFSDNTPSGLGAYSVGAPIVRRTQYYNTPFYSENLKGFAGILEIEGEQTHAIMYEGYPLTLRFDEDGKHIGDDVIEVVIIE